ncbi:hypothetical protein [Brevibacillus sp. SIMBA_040]|uniref:hypothetical protein n=1 Tax=unclassified Brevibacillus TaxID=2684853 RepID=UPI00397DB209
MGYALHEQLELHEIAAFKSVCMTKSKTMQGFVTDEALKQLLAEDVDVSTRQLHELNLLLTKANT